MALKAPFNFVPLSEKEPFFPEWADCISQDVPFKDGLSGYVEYSIEACSPIFVRNGAAGESHSKEKDPHFSNVDGSFFLPGTSIKGAIRSVMEIMSFGKMTHVQDRSFGIRDVSNKTDDSRFYFSRINTKNVCCGWLYKKDEDYFIEDNGIPWRISIDRIDSQLGTNLQEFVTKGDFTVDSNKSAKKKYDTVGESNLTWKFIDLPSKDGRKKVTFASNGKPGTIVFTGQPSARGEKGGKWYEFVFPDVIEKTRKVDKFVINEFFDTHKNSPDFKWRIKQLDSEKERIPVFFVRGEEDGVDSLGLAYMYRYPAFNSVHGGIPESSFSRQKDLVECIFGTVNQDDQLKGRVSFSHAFVDAYNGEESIMKLALASPNPSYYPMYLRDGKSWNCTDITIAGYKRYPVRNKLLPSPTGTPEMERDIIPLKSGTRFKGRVYFHNLRPVELGAVLSAMTFHGQESKCYHSLGCAKPLGYGKSKLSIRRIVCPECNCKVEEFLGEFENLMDNHCTDWVHSSCLVELFAMAKGIKSGNEDNFEYISSPAEFAKAKKEGNTLGLFTEIESGISSSIVTKPESAGSAYSSKPRHNKAFAMFNDALDLYYCDKLKESRMLFDVCRKLGVMADDSEEYLAKINDRFAVLFSEKFLEGQNYLDIREYVVARTCFRECLDYIPGDTAAIDKIALIDSMNESDSAEYLKLKSDARSLIQGKQYDEAIAKYANANVLAQRWGFVDLRKEIERCNELKAEQLANMSKGIADVVKFGSVGACAGNLKKWIADHGALTDSDVNVLRNKFMVEMASGKLKKKEWQISGLKKIREVVGDDLVLRIFS